MKPFLSILFDPDLARRQQMVETQLRQRGIRDPRVLEAMLRLPRHEFVQEAYRSQAYDDNPLPIGDGQTISQPYIVALMLQLLDLQPEQDVLEVGTGSGYQTALLAELSHHVYTIERHPALAARASDTLGRFGYRNVAFVVGDGSSGLPAHAPFDRIIVSAAAPTFPQSLFDQLRERGRLVVPIGPPRAQSLQLISKVENRPVISEEVPCRFVPLIGSQGYSE